MSPRWNYFNKGDTLISHRRRHSRSPGWIAKLGKVQAGERPERIEIKRAGQVIGFFLCELQKREQNLSEYWVRVRAELDAHSRLVTAQPHELCHDLTNTFAGIAVPLDLRVSGDSKEGVIIGFESGEQITQVLAHKFRETNEPTAAGGAVLSDLNPRREAGRHFNATVKRSLRARLT
jgi:hypothetical protein